MSEEPVVLRCGFCGLLRTERHDCTSVTKPPAPMPIVLDEEDMAWMNTPMGPLPTIPPVTQTAIAALEAERDQLKRQVETLETAKAALYKERNQLRAMLDRIAAIPDVDDGYHASNEESIADGVQAVVDCLHDAKTDLHAARETAARLRDCLASIANIAHGNDRLHTLLGIEDTARRALTDQYREQVMAIKAMQSGEIVDPMG